MKNFYFPTSFTKKSYGKNSSESREKVVGISVSGFTFVVKEFSCNDDFSGCDCNDEDDDFVVIVVVVRLLFLVY